MAEMLGHNGYTIFIALLLAAGGALVLSWLIGWIWWLAVILAVAGALGTFAFWPVDTGR